MNNTLPSSPDAIAVVSESTTDSSKKVVNLMTWMILQPGSELTVVCQSSIKIEQLDKSSAQYCTCHTKPYAIPHLLVTAECPTTITATSPIRISPTEQLNDLFARGWHRLPSKLKVKILSFNLSLSHNIVYDEDYQGDFHKSRTLRRYIDMGPQIAPFAKQAFYENNIVQLSWSAPPQEVRHHIRKAFILVNLPIAVGWDALKDLVNPDNGYIGLEHVEIKFDMDSINEELKSDEEDEEEEEHGCSMPTDRADFLCKGALVFDYGSGRAECLRDELRDVESAFRKQISFASLSPRLRKRIQLKAKTFLTRPVEQSPEFKQCTAHLMQSFRRHSLCITR
jgi:hypothetical protein